VDLQEQFDNLRAVALGIIQRENGCKITGAQCREPDKCGCDLELIQACKDAPNWRGMK